MLINQKSLLVLSLLTALGASSGPSLFSFSFLFFKASIKESFSQFVISFLVLLIGTTSWGTRNQGIPLAWWSISGETFTVSGNSVHYPKSLKGKWDFSQSVSPFSRPVSGCKAILWLSGQGRVSALNLVRQRGRISWLFFTCSRLKRASL